MLQNALLLAAHDLVILGVLQQHTDNGFLRHNAVNAALQAAVCRALIGVLTKTRAVVAVYCRDPFGQLLRCVERRIQRQIAALGMPAQHQRAARMCGGHLQQIFQRHALGRHGFHIAQVKILFPADQGIVGAAVGQIDAALPQIKCGGRKLRFRLFIHQLHGREHLHAAKALALGRRAQQRAKLVGLKQRHIFNNFSAALCQKQACRLTQRQPLIGGDALKIHIGQLAEDQVIHFVEGRCGKRNVSAPVEVIQNRCHAAKLPFCTGSSPGFHHRGGRGIVCRHKNMLPAGGYAGRAARPSPGALLFCKFSRLFSQ